MWEGGGGAINSNSKFQFFSEVKRKSKLGTWNNFIPAEILSATFMYRICRLGVEVYMCTAGGGGGGGVVVVYIYIYIYINLCLYPWGVVNSENTTR